MGENLTKDESKKDSSTATINGKNIEEIIKNYSDMLEVLCGSTDDFLFLLDIKNDKNRFFGAIDEEYAVNRKGETTNTISEMLEIVHPADCDMVENKLKEITDGIKEVLNVECRLINKKGESVWVSCRGNAIKDDVGKPALMVGRVSREALKYLFNPLTGLFNQFRLLPELKRKLEGTDGGVMLLVDIDDLSAINLTHGRKYGDELLKGLAAALESLLEVGKVYHTERNCFAACLDSGDDEAAVDVFARLQTLMGDKCTVSASVVPFDKGAFDDENALFDSAKIILRKAKNKGQNTIEFFSKEKIKQKISSVELLEELQESINNNFEGFFINYQPQVKSGSYELFSAEALVRYKSRTGERIFPDEFISLLEQTKLIVNVGKWVLEQALIQCREWRRTIKDMHISVNFSMVQFRDELIVSDVLGVLEKTGMPGEALTIELTESIPVEEIEHFKNIIKELKKHGIKIAIDDFGTGYSNIAYLKQLNVDEIKIDRMFVKGIEENSYNYRVVSNTLDFAKMNSIRICCEGVETIKELVVLESLFPDIMQGYLFDKPCDEEEFKEKYLYPKNKKYLERVKFIKELYQYKNEMNTIHFSAKDILRETNVGLWVVRINEKEQHYEMHADETMERIMGIDKKYTPSECYNFWYSRVNEEYRDYVDKNIQVMASIDKVVQLQYPWQHPQLGEVIVRSNGRRTKDTDGMFVLEGYHRILTNIKEV